MKRLPAFFALAALLLSCNGNKSAETPAGASLKVPDGFRSSIVIDSIGKARHLVVTPQGEIYVRLAEPKNGQGTLLLSNQAGKYSVKTGFGNYGGTGIAIKDGYLYSSSYTDVYRYKLDENSQVTAPDAPETIVTGLIDRQQHNTKSLALDNAGNIYVNIGAFSNSCQIQDRQKGSLGMKPCPILDSAGGIWMFKASVPRQSYKEGIRFATGLRNVVGLDWNQELNQLFVMQHGRDQLSTIFPDLFNDKQSADLPAECMYALKQGDNCGWPYIYYDDAQHKKILAPEYGGDGKKEGGSEFLEPVAAYPAHMGPNALLFYTGTQFPGKYRSGAFIAFHGSWNRAPEPQSGYFVVFQPFNGGKPSGPWEVFADGFAGGPDKISPGKADRRPCGLAQGPDGALYVSDDVRGTIYKIEYAGQ